MKDWEIAKVNHLYKQVDALQDENKRLSEVNRCGDLDQVIKAIADLSRQLAENKCECKCDCGSTTTTKKTVKRSK